MPHQRLEHAGTVKRIRAYQELAVQRLLNHALLARMIEHDAPLGETTYRRAEKLDDAREMIWRELATGEVIDTYRHNLQRGRGAQPSSCSKVSAVTNTASPAWG